MSNLRNLIDVWVDERHPDQEILLAEGFEEAFVGVAYQFDKPVAVFDREKCITILSKDMSPEEAEEYFQFNVEGAYVGPNTPAFLDKFHSFATKEEAWVAQFEKISKNSTRNKKNET
jgi:hypothetical protein